MYPCKYTAPNTHICRVIIQISFEGSRFICKAGTYWVLPVESLGNLHLAHQTAQRQVTIYQRCTSVL